MTNQKKEIQIVSVKSIVYSSGKILMLKSHDGRWELPGGRIKFGERPKQALKRELKEELGLDKVQVGKIIDVWDYVFKKNHIILMVFSCYLDSNNFKISPEHLEYRWIDKNKIYHYPMKYGYTKFLEDLKETDLN